MSESPQLPGDQKGTDSRLVLLRDVAVLQVKLIVDLLVKRDWGYREIIPDKIFQKTR